MPASRETPSASEELYAREEEQSLRHSWLTGSIASSVMVLAGCFLLFCCAVTAFFYLSLRNELSECAESAVAYLTKYALSDQDALRTGATSYVETAESRNSMELHMTPDAVLVDVEDALEALGEE